MPVIWNNDGGKISSTIICEVLFNVMLIRTFYERSAGVISNVVTCVRYEGRFYFYVIFIPMAPFTNMV